MYRKNRPNNREKGVLLPVFSLPSRYGIGCFSQEARDFIDWLKETGHTYWQILPLNPTGVADSPYQPLSSFAGNAYFIDPEQLVSQGLIRQEELDVYDFGDDPMYVDYEILYDNRMAMLGLAYKRFRDQRLDRASVSDAYEKFLAENAFWIDDYALFMSLRLRFGKELSWDDWPEGLRHREPEAIAQAASEEASLINFYRWTQFEFYRQWGELKKYANAAGISIIGDMPVYVSYDSADCWAAPGQFQLGEDLMPAWIAGVPPDDFAEEGQLWGNPLYDWAKMKEDGYAWWISRLRQSFKLYDVIRLDHFRGYEAYYSCRADAENAMHGVWHKGPGLELFRALEEEIGDWDDIDGSIPLSERFIAEDLGFLTEEVHELLRRTGFPGTRVLQFAFDGDPENLYLPENFHENCVVYTGTHDNDTTVGWFRSLEGDTQAGILQYLGMSGIDAWKLVLENDAYRKAHARREGLAATAAGTAAGIAAATAAAAFDPSAATAAADPAAASDPAAPPDPAIPATDLLIQKALDSRAKIAIIPLQDYLHLGSEARTNTPGTVVNNWCVRMPDVWRGKLHF